MRACANLHQDVESRGANATRQASLREMCDTRIGKLAVRQKARGFCQGWTQPGLGPSALGKGSQFCLSFARDLNGWTVLTLVGILLKALVSSSSSSRHTSVRCMAAVGNGTQGPFVCYLQLFLCVMLQGATHRMQRKHSKATGL